MQPLRVGRGGDAEGALALAEDAVEAELPGAEGEGLALGGIDELQPEGADERAPPP